MLLRVNRQEDPQGTPIITDIDPTVMRRFVEESIDRFCR